MLVLFDRLDEIGRVHQGLMCPGVKPCESLSEQFHIQPSLLQIDPVQICDLQFPSRAGLKVLRVLNDLVIVEIKPRYAVVALRVGGLLLDGFRLAVLVERDNAETLRIIHVVAEYRSAGSRIRIPHCCHQALPETVSEEDVVTQDHAYIVTADEFFTDNECLRKSVRAWLHGIGQMNAELMAVSQQFLKPRCIRRRGNDQYIPYPCPHQNRHRIIDHRLVIDRQQLFRSYHGERIQPGSASSCQNDSLHCHVLLIIRKL